jgi:hypothetical protein
MNLDDARRRTLGSAFGNDSLTYGTLPQWMPDQQVAWRTAAAELSFMVAPFGAVDGSGLSSQSEQPRSRRGHERLSDRRTREPVAHILRKELSILL